MSFRRALKFLTFAPSRSSSKASTRTSACDTNTLCHPTPLMTKCTTGSCQTLRLARKLVVVASSRGFRFATSATRASSRRSCAGKMLRTKGLRRYQGHAMTSLALLIGGLVHGSRVLWRASEMVKDNPSFLSCKLKKISPQATFTSRWKSERFSAWIRTSTLCLPNSAKTSCVLATTNRAAQFCRSAV